MKALGTFIRLPCKKHILGRHYTLLELTKEKNARMVMITEEPISLCEKLSFYNIPKQVIMAKL